MKPYHYVAVLGQLVDILPANIDRSTLVDITRIGDSARRYLDPATGRVYDCAEYAKQMLDFSEPAERGE